MGLRLIQCLIHLMAFSLCTGTLVQGTRTIPYTLQPTEDIPQKDIETPITTIPVINPSSNPTINPTNPTVTTNPTFTYPTPSTPLSTTPTMTPNTTPTMTPITTPNTTPTMTPITTPNTTPAMTPVTPSTSEGSAGGQSWCIASQSTSETALQVALDYACGYGGADCSAIQQGGSCSNPDTVRDHASYAFNNYYQKNPVPTSCDFGGTAVLTSVDPSTATCKFESTSTSSSVLNPTNPTGSTVFGSSPPYVNSGSTSALNNIMPFIGLILLLLSYISLNV